MSLTDSNKNKNYSNKTSNNTKVLVGVFVCMRCVIYSIIARRIVSGIYACVFLRLVPFPSSRTLWRTTFRTLLSKGSKKRKKEKENVLVSIQIFKNFQKFLPSHDSKERATEHSLLSRAALNSGFKRSKRAHSRKLSFGLLLKVPSSNASKLSHKSEKMSVDCAKNS